VLGRGSDKFVEALHDVRKRESRSLTACVFQQRQQALFAEFLLFFVSCFGDTVGVDDQEIGGSEPSDTCLVVFQDLDTKGDVVGFQTLNATILACENRRVVPGAEVGEISCCGVQFGKEGSRKTPILTIGTDLSIQTSYKFRKRTSGTCQSAPGIRGRNPRIVAMRPAQDPITDRALHLRAQRVNAHLGERPLTGRLQIRW